MDTLTEVVSHELAEAITDPTGTGWYDPNSDQYDPFGSKNDEVGDICNRQTSRLGGYLVQTEWSNAAGACIAPSQVPKQSSSSFAVSAVPGYVEVFWVRPDGMVFTNGRDPNVNRGRWNNPIAIAPNPGSADPRSGVAAISTVPGIVEVFWIRPDGMVFTNGRDPGVNGGQWNNPIAIAPNPGSADPRSGVAAVSRSPGSVEVFWVRPDGVVFTNGRDPGVNGGQWNNPIAIAANPGSADPRSGMAAVSPVPGLFVVEVFWVRPDGMVFTNARDLTINNGQWNNPIPIAPSPGSAAIRDV